MLWCGLPLISDVYCDEMSHDTREPKADGEAGDVHVISVDGAVVSDSAEEFPEQWMGASGGIRRCGGAAGSQLLRSGM